MMDASAISQVQWPAVIQYQGDEELAYFSSEADWQADAELQHAPFTKQDRLIDSKGQVFHLHCNSAGGVALQPSDDSIDLPDFTTLLRAHAVVAGSCCAGKVGCNDFAEGMRLIGQMEDS